MKICLLPYQDEKEEKPEQKATKEYMARKREYYIIDSGMSNPHPSRSPANGLCFSFTKGRITTFYLFMKTIATNGIVIATEKKAVSTLIDDSSLEKVAIICSNIGMVYSGMGPDYRVLVNKARKAAQAYKRVYMEEPPTAILVKEIASVMQEFTQSG
jgi:hypothetical protein